VADVLIAGGGPAGATLAVLLGRAGLEVELYDARRFPREKPCGEGLMPAGVAVLERLGLAAAVGGRRLYGVRYHGFGVTAESTFPAVEGAPASMLAQRRLHLDRALFEAARATPGVCVFEDASVEGAVVEGGRAVGLTVGGEQRRGRLVIGADGLESTVRRSLGLDGPPRRPQRAGVRVHFRLPAGREPPDRLEIFLGDGHELYVAPLPERELLVAGLCRPEALAGGARAPLARWIDGEARLRDLLDGAEPLTEVAGRRLVARRARAGVAPGAVLLGDAAGSTDPLTAGGIAHALVTAERLAAHVPRALAEGPPESGDRWLRRFDRQRRRLLRDHGALTRVLVTLVARPGPARATLRVMRAQPALMRHLLGVAAGVRRIL
jgi:2-polyprenyl-6-methoxyphenol hydroxylase-like FAD-dependent oxidoreductase